MKPAEHEIFKKISNKRKVCSNLTETTQIEKWQEICCLCCLLQYILYQNTLKERPAKKDCFSVPKSYLECTNVYKNIVHPTHLQ